MLANKLSLRWRIAALTALAIAILSIIAAFSTFVVVKKSISGDLRAALRRDAKKLAKIYNGRASQEEIKLSDVPSGRVIIQIYDLTGHLFASSVKDYELEQSAISQDIIQKAQASKDVEYWQGSLLSQNLVAALAPFDRGVVAVLSTTDFMDTALRQLARNLFVMSLIISLISAAIAYLVATAAMRPVSELARLTAELGPDNLVKIEHKGPDDELASLTNVINELTARLKESMDAQRIFLAETSHELRTPLTSLQGFLDRASRKAHPSVRRDLADASRISQTMSRLVADLLQLSRGQLVKEMVPHLLDPYRDILLPIAEEYKGVTLKGKPGEILVGDPERLRQLLRNLVANAVRATGDPAKVELSMRKDDNAIIIEVADSGPGIPEDRLESIFEKFYKGPGGGAGLGLAIARQIAEAHKGKLTVESELGKGTVFSLRLNLVDDDEDL